MHIKHLPVPGTMDHQGYINKETKIPAMKKHTFRKNVLCYSSCLWIHPHHLHFFTGAVYFSYTELVVIILKPFSVAYLFACSFSTCHPKSSFNIFTIQIKQSPLSIFFWLLSPAELKGLSSMSYWPQWWLLHLNIIATLLVHEFLEGRSGVLIIFLLPDDMVSR